MLLQVLLDFMRISIRFTLEQPETRNSQTGEGMLKKIGDGGILFQVELPLPVQLGHTQEFSFPLIPDKNKQCDPTHVQAQGLALRIEPPDPNSLAYGVAVQFLSALKKKDVTRQITISSRRRVGTLPKPLKDER
jgi:hypothetical protein